MSWPAFTNPLEELMADEHITKISDYELQRGDPVYASEDFVTKSKVVETEDKPAPKKSTARSKSK